MPAQASPLPPLPNAADRAGLLLFLVPTLIWGTTWLVIKFQLGVVAPEVSVGWRFALAAALLHLWCLVRGVPLRLPWRRHLELLLLGLLLFGVNYVFTYRSEGYLTSGLVAVLFASMAFWNLLGARLFFGTPAPLAVLAWCVARGLPLTFDARPAYVLSLLYLPGRSGRTSGPKQLTTGCRKRTVRQLVAE